MGIRKGVRLRHRGAPIVETLVGAESKFAPFAVEGERDNDSSISKKTGEKGKRKDASFAPPHASVKDEYDERYGRQKEKQEYQVAEVIHGLNLHKDSASLFAEYFISQTSTGPAYSIGSMIEASAAVPLPGNCTITMADSTRTIPSV